jgi:menaquinone-dependent protoporphyrinogen oxidase
MKVLVTAASRYGATQEIADAIGEVLVHRGLEVTTVPIDRAGPPAGHDAVVLGSAVYMGQWLKAARAYVEANAAALRDGPVWLFSSGPLGTPPKPDPDALDLSAIVDATAPRGTRVFGGRIDRSLLRLADRAVVAALKAPESDDRPWPEIEAWAHEIADALLLEEEPGIAPAEDAGTPAPR